MYALVALAERSYPIIIPLSYLMNPDGAVERFNYSQWRSDSHRFKGYTEHFEDTGYSHGGKNTCEQRTNLKGDEAMPEIATCQILAGLRWGISQLPTKNTYEPHPEIGGIPLHPDDKEWWVHYQKKIDAMRIDPVVLYSFGEETVQGLADYFQKKLDKTLAVCSVAALETSSFKGTPKSTKTI